MVAFFCRSSTELLFNLWVDDNPTKNVTLRRPTGTAVDSNRRCLLCCDVSGLTILSPDKRVLGHIALPDATTFSVVVARGFYLVASGANVYYIPLFDDVSNNYSIKGTRVS